METVTGCFGKFFKFRAQTENVEWPLSPHKKHRSVILVHLWSVQENCTPKMLPWLPPFCFTQDPQYTLVTLPHNQPYNLSKRLWAVIFIEFLIILLRLHFADYRRHELAAQWREQLWSLVGRLEFMCGWEVQPGLPTLKPMKPSTGQSQITLMNKTFLWFVLWIKLC